jgi:hypothetical protein
MPGIDPAYAGLQRRTSRRIPIVILELMET